MAFLCALDDDFDGGVLPIAATRAARLVGHNQSRHVGAGGGVSMYRAHICDCLPIFPQIPFVGGNHVVAMHGRCFGSKLDA